MPHIAVAFGRCVFRESPGWPKKGSFKKGGPGMAVQEKTTFIPDPKPDMTREEKNLHLAYKLGVAPQPTQNIFRIERAEIGAAGWLIHYRVVVPD